LTTFTKTARYWWAKQKNRPQFRDVRLLGKAKNIMGGDGKSKSKNARVPVSTRRALNARLRAEKKLGAAHA